MSAPRQGPNLKRVISSVICGTCAAVLVLWKAEMIPNAENIRRTLLAVPGSTKTVILGDIPGTTPTNLLPDSIRNEILAKNYRILALGNNLAKEGSAVEYLSNNYYKVDVITPRTIASCPNSIIKSKVGDSPVDFIFLDYYYCLDGLIELTRILRTRFPKAVIVLLDIWSPLFVHYVDELGENVNIRDWALMQGYPKKKVDAIKLFGASSKNWKQLQFPNKKSCMGVLQKESQAYAIRKERDDVVPESQDDFRQMVVERLFLYQNDWVGLSGNGQVDCARGMADLIKYLNHTKSDEVGVWPDDHSTCIPR